MTAIRSRLPADAWIGVIACALLAGFAASQVPAWPWAPARLAGVWYPVKVMVVFVVGAGLAGAAWTRTMGPSTRFGAANQITLLRLAMVSLLAGLVGEPVAAHAWAIVVVASVSTALDGVDGRIARARGTASRFGARFDMETDALMVAVLSGLVFLADKAGVWVLASGAMRYVYVAAGAVWPWLRAEPRPSLLRKTVCIVQITVLIVALAPVVGVPWSNTLAAAGLLVLCASFGRDVLDLRRAARRTLAPRSSSTLQARDVAPATVDGHP